jgi:hypothetical protein
MKKIKVELEFEVGTLSELISEHGYGGFKQSWLDGEREGRSYSVTCGAGVGTPDIDASVVAVGGGDRENIYARCDFSKAVQGQLWPQMAAIQDEVAEEIRQSESTP